MGRFAAETKGTGMSSTDVRTSVEPPHAPFSGRAPRPGGAPLLVMLLVCAGVTIGARGGAAPQEPSAPGTAYDAIATDTARVLAGMAPSDSARFEEATKRAAWIAYRDDVSRNWARLETERFSVMRAWSSREVLAAAGPCDTLFYPFGGPDLINAYVLFPGCSRYLLFGLEPVGSMPVVGQGDPGALDVLLNELRASLSDMFVRDYFITREMMTDQKTPGVNGTLPLLLVFLARVDARIVDIRMESPWAGAEPAAGAEQAPGPSANAVRRQPQRPTAVTIRFTVPGSTRIQTLTYARVRMEDAEFAKQEALVAYLERHAPFTTLLKSASYLLHDRQFSKVRGLVLAGSRAVLQDDTGVPYRFFDKAAWRVRLYGRYSPPVKDFNYGNQPDLEQAYRDSAAVRDLPFSFGYHWRQGTASVMLAVRTESTR
jgi:hypothetical protein